MYKDKYGDEHRDFTDISFYDEEEVTCPCCGNDEGKEVLVQVVLDYGRDVKCSKCGCVFTSLPYTTFTNVCDKYRTDGKEGEIK